MKRITLNLIFLCMLFTCELFSQNFKVGEINKTVLQEGNLRSQFHNIPHIGIMNFDDQEPVSYQVQNNMYFYFNSLLVGARVKDEISGNKMSIVIPSAYRFSRNGMKNYSFSPIDLNNNNQLIRASDETTWPSDWIGWQGYFSEDTRSSEEIYFKSSDQQMTLYSESGQYLPFSENATIGGLGLTVETHVLAWNSKTNSELKTLDDTFVIVHKVKNNSLKDLDSLIVSNWIADMIGFGSPYINREFIPSKKTILFHDSNIKGVAAITQLNNNLDMKIYPFQAGQLQVNIDDNAYKFMASSEDSSEIIGSNIPDSDILISTSPNKLNSGEIIEYAYAITVSKEEDNFEENRSSVLAKSAYIQEQFKANFTLDNLNEIELSDSITKLNLQIDMSLTDSLISMDGGNVIAEVTNNNEFKSYELVDIDNDNIYEKEMEVQKNSFVKFKLKVDNVELPGDGYERTPIELDTLYFNNNYVNKVVIKPIKYFRNIESSGFPVPTDYEVIFGDIGIGKSQAFSYKEYDLPSRSVNFKINKAGTNESVLFAFDDIHSARSKYGSRCSQGGDLRPGAFSSWYSANGYCGDEILILNDIDDDSELEAVESLEMLAQNKLSPDTGDTLFVYKKLQEREILIEYVPFYMNDSFITPSETQNSTATENDSKIVGFNLFDNYPNPFNPSTTIKFSLDSPGKISLEVYNILGRKVTTLIDRKVSSGTHLIPFSASNLSSGVYFYKLTSSGETKTKKMLLIK